MDEGSAGRGRLTQKGLAMRERIVEAAADLVFKSGARETSLDEVRHEVGASKSQLYHYFSDKDGLISAVIDFQGLRVLEAQQPELGAIDSWETLRRWRDKLVQLAGAYGRAGGCPIGSLANELAAQDQGFSAALSSQFAAWAAQIEQGFAAMQARGALAADHDPKGLSLLFLTAIQGGLLFAKLQRSSERLATVLDQLIGLIERPAGPAPQHGPSAGSGRAP